MNVIGRAMLWALIDLLGTSLGVALMAVHPQTPKADGVKEKAEYLVTLSWSNTQDGDVDDWLAIPSGKPVFYSSRDSGCARLDQDDRGFLDGKIKLADGSVISVPEFKETISIRCIESGHYDAAANLYAYHENGNSQDARKDIGLKVHAEIIGVNPSIHTLWAKDIVLDYVGQTVNWGSFDLTRDGAITLTDTPLESVTEKWQREAGSHSGGYTPGGYP